MVRFLQLVDTPKRNQKKKEKERLWAKTYSLPLLLGLETGAVDRAGEYHGRKAPAYYDCFPLGKSIRRW